MGDGTFEITHYAAWPTFFVVNLSLKRKQRNKEKWREGNYNKGIKDKKKRGFRQMIHKIFPS
jgi:hypothetical protein